MDDSNLVHDETGPSGSAMRPMILIQRAMPVALVVWAIQFYAREYGILSVAFLSLGFGSIRGIVLPIKAGKSVSMVLPSARGGAVVGVLAWALCLAPVLFLLGYKDDTAPRKRCEAGLAEVERAMRAFADRAPWDRLDRSVENACAQLPDHPTARPHAVAGLVARLEDPVIRPQVVLAMGRFESQTATILPILETLLKDEDPSVRAAATVALSGMRPWSATMKDRILSMLSDRDDRVQDAGTTALSRIAGFLGPEDVEPLRKAASVSGPQVRSRVEELAIAAEPGRCARTRAGLNR